MRRPIKHILDDFVNNEAGGVTRSINLVTGINNANPYDTVQSRVNAGSAIVRQIHLMVTWRRNYTAVAGASAVSQLDWYVWFNIAGAQTRPTPNAAGSNDLKNQIFHQDCALLGQNEGAGVTDLSKDSEAHGTWNVTINVPKWAQKINMDDNIELVYLLSDASANVIVKMKAIFMEYEQS